MSKLLELVERVEKLDGPSRHIDTQIEILLDPGAQHIIGHEEGPFPRKPIYGPRSSFWEWACDDSMEPPAFGGISTYTDSLDAATSLVPEGWVLGIQQNCHTAGGWCAKLTRTDGGNVQLDFAQAFASTPALALTAAALRARAASLTGEG